MSVDEHTHSAIFSSCLCWYVLKGLLNQHLVCVAKASGLNIELASESKTAACSCGETATSLEVNLESLVKGHVRVQNGQVAVSEVLFLSFLSTRLGVTVLDSDLGSSMIIIIFKMNSSKDIPNTAERQVMYLQSFICEYSPWLQSRATQSPALLASVLDFHLLAFFSFSFS